VQGNSGSDLSACPAFSIPSLSLLLSSGSPVKEKRKAKQSFSDPAVVPATARRQR
jgi:hypothetical protein